jgi:hypothetical protein
MITLLFGCPPEKEFEQQLFSFDGYTRHCVSKINAACFPRRFRSGTRPIEGRFFGRPLCLDGVGTIGRIIAFGCGKKARSSNNRCVSVGFVSRRRGDPLEISLDLSFQ